jgi:RNA polymerase sigma factor (sigma-70 family)
MTSADEEFDAFYRRKLRPLITWVRAAGLPAEDAADVAQEAMLLTYQHWSSVDPREGHRFVYAMRTAQHLCIDGWRRAGRERTGLAAAASLLRDVQDPDAGSTEALDMLRDLDLPVREVMFLRYYAGLPLCDIAVLLGRNPSTVRTQALKGREDLRSSADPKGDRSWTTR